MNREQFLAFTALGLLLMESPNELSAYMTFDEQLALRNDVEKYLFPRVDEDADIVPMIIEVVHEALREVKDRA